MCSKYVNDVEGHTSVHMFVRSLIFIAEKCSCHLDVEWRISFYSLPLFTYFLEQHRQMDR